MKIQTRALCANLDQLLLRTIQSFCEVNVRYCNNLHLSGSLHIRADNEEVTSFLINEKKQKIHIDSDTDTLNKQESGWSPAALSDAATEDVRNPDTAEASPESKPDSLDDSPQGLPLSRSILGRRAIRAKGRGRRDRLFSGTPRRFMVSPLTARISQKRQALHERFTPGSCSTPMAASFDSGCHSSEDYHRVSNAVHGVVNIERNEVHVKQETTESCIENDNPGDETTNTEERNENVGNATRSFDTEIIHDGERTAHIYQIHLPSYASATGLNKVGSELSGDVNVYDTLDSPDQRQNDKENNCVSSKSVRFHAGAGRNTNNHYEALLSMVTQPNGPLSMVKHPDTPRPIGTQLDTPRPMGTQLDMPRLIRRQIDTPRPTRRFTDTSRPIGRQPDTPRPMGRLQTCTICGRRFMSRSELKIHHSRMHRALPPHPTQSPLPSLQLPPPPLFNMSASSSSGDRSHITGSGVDEICAKYPCSQCGALLKAEDEYRSHILSQHKCMKIYPCSFCDREYFSKQEQQQHQQHCCQLETERNK